MTEIPLKIHRLPLFNCFVYLPFSSSQPTPYHSHIKIHKSQIPKQTLKSKTMKCYKSSSILTTNHHPFFYKQQPISSLQPSSFPSTLSYPTRTRFSSTRIQSRLTHDDPVKQSEDLSFYDLLGVTESVTLPEIKQAYKQLARKYHPDVSPPDRVEEYTDRFIRVQEAYETLSDPRRRVLYDRDLSMGFSFSFSGKRRNRYDEVINY